MKLALLIALAPDRRSGRVLSGILPADQAVSQVKQVIASGECPDAAFPILQAISTDSRLREHRFKVTADDIERDIERDSEPAAPVSTSGIVLISVEVGEGDDKAIINVTSAAEADCVRNLELARAAAIKECDRQRALVEAQAATIADLEAKLADKKAKPK